MKDGKIYKKTYLDNGSIRFTITNRHAHLLEKVFAKRPELVEFKHKQNGLTAYRISRHCELVDEVTQVLDNHEHYTLKHRQQNRKLRGWVSNNRAELVSLLQKRDGNNCCRCGHTLDFNNENAGKLSVTIEHVKPIRDGGTNDLENLALSHYFCNTTETAYNPEQPFKMKTISIHKFEKQQNDEALIWTISKNHHHAENVFGVIKKFNHDVILLNHNDRVVEYKILNRDINELLNRMHDGHKRMMHHAKKLGYFDSEVV